MIQKYQTLFNAGEYLMSTIKLEDANATQIFARLSSNYPAEVLIKSGIVLNSNILNHKVQSVSWMYSNAPTQVKRITLKGRAVLNNYTPSTPVERLRKISVDATLRSILGRFPMQQKQNTSKFSEMGLIRYLFFIRGNQDHVLSLNTYDTFTLPELEQFASIIDRKGTCDIYQTTKNTSRVLPMTSPIRLKFYKYGGEGGDVIIPSSDLASFVAFIMNLGYTWISKIPL